MADAKRLPGHIVWSTRKLDLSDLWLRKWYIQQVLVHGRAEDVAQLDWEKVRKLLPELHLPDDARRLWEEYFTNQAETKC